MLFALSLALSYYLMESRWLTTDAEKAATGVFFIMLFVIYVIQTSG